MPTTKQDRYCEAVDLILARMDSNPDEFNLTRSSKWGDVLSLCRQRLTGGKDYSGNLVVLGDHEVSAIWHKFVEVGKQELLKEFMRRILDVPKEEELGEEK